MFTAGVAVVGRYPLISKANCYGVKVSGQDWSAGCVVLDVEPDNKANMNLRNFVRYAREQRPRYVVLVSVRFARERVGKELVITTSPWKDS